MGLLRISAKTHPMQNAKAIAGMIHHHNHAEVQAIGRPAVHQAMKAIAQATAHLKEQGIYVGFTESILRWIPIAMRRKASGFSLIYSEQNPTPCHECKRL